ncbi:MAG: transketolase [Burkholderia sp.]|nr:transketolase [Burkholderia sp.]
MRAVALSCRRAILDALFASGGGHYGGALSVVDILLALYDGVPGPGADRQAVGERVILSKGHAAIALYAVLAHHGRIEPSRLAAYGALGAGLEGHPDMATNPEVDFSTGSLGLGLGAGLGMALARRDRGVWVVLGDGECQEGAVWEAALVAERYRVGNLHAVVDHNRVQEIGFGLRPGLETDPVPRLAAKFEAFGWATVAVDGHDFEQLLPAIAAVRAGRDRPTAVIAATVKGRGVPRFEAEPERYHCATLSAAEHAQALAAVR